jgi:hypothetical protein
VAFSLGRYEQIHCVCPADCYQITERVGLEEMAMLKRIGLECLITKNLRDIGKRSHPIVMNQEIRLLASFIFLPIFLGVSGN